MKTLDELFEAYQIPGVVDLKRLIHLTKQILETRTQNHLGPEETLSFLERVISYKERGEFPQLVLIELDRFMAVQGETNAGVFTHGILHWVGTINLKHATRFIPPSFQRSLENEVLYARWVDTSDEQLLLFHFIKHRLWVLHHFDLPNQNLYDSRTVIPLGVLQGMIASVTDPDTFGPTWIPAPVQRNEHVEQVKMHLPTACDSSILQELLDYIQWLLSLYQKGAFYPRGSEGSWNPGN